MASFAGLDMGIVEEFDGPTAEPKARQVNAYPGVDGLELLDMGNRGDRVSIRGWVAGVDLLDLSGIKQAWRALVKDGGQYTLIDPDGVTWLGVILVHWRAHGPRRVLGGDQGVAQRFEAEYLMPNG